MNTQLFILISFIAYLFMHVYLKLLWPSDALYAYLKLLGPNDALYSNNHFDA